MSGFGHLFVFVSIILGLAVTEILSGIGDLIEHRERVHIYWVHLVAVAIMFVLVVQMWWACWDYQNLDWKYESFLLVLTPPTAMYLACKLCFPTIVEQGTIDLESHYYSIHSWLYGLLSFYFLTVWLSAVFLRKVPFRDWSNIVRVSAFLLAVAAAAITEKTIHAGLVVIALILLLLFLVYYTRRSLPTLPTGDERTETFGFRRSGR